MCAVEYEAMSAYWRQVCLDPPPTPAHPARVSSWSDSWGLGTLLLALTDDLGAMRMQGFQRFRRTLSIFARRQGDAAAWKYCSDAPVAPDAP